MDLLKRRAGMDRAPRLGMAAIGQIKQYTPEVGAGRASRILEVCQTLAGGGKRTPSHVDFGF